jgi:hypothetical protein
MAARFFESGINHIVNRYENKGTATDAKHKNFKIYFNTLYIVCIKL